MCDMHHASLPVSSLSHFSSVFSHHSPPLPPGSGSGGSSMTTASPGVNYFVRARVCTYTCTCIHARARVYIHIHKETRTRTRGTHAHTHPHTLSHTLTHTLTHTYTHLQVRGLEESLGSPNAAPAASDEDDECVLQRFLLCIFVTPSSLCVFL